MKEIVEFFFFNIYNYNTKDRYICLKEARSCEIRPTRKKNETFALQGRKSVKDKSKRKHKILVN